MNELQIILCVVLFIIYKLDEKEQLQTVTVLYYKIYDSIRQAMIFLSSSIE